MNKTITFRPNKEIQESLDHLKKELNISQSDIIRMAIAHFKKYVEKVNK